METIEVLFSLSVLAMALVDEFGIYISVPFLGGIVIEGMRNIAIFSVVVRRVVIVIVRGVC
jgi:hypothetical protein